MLLTSCDCIFGISADVTLASLPLRRKSLVYCDVKVTDADRLVVVKCREEETCMYVGGRNSHKAI